MHDLRRITLLFDRPFDYLRQRHGPMPPSGASQCDRQIAFSFLNVVRNQVQQQALDSPQELAGLRKGTDVPRDARILSAEWAQPRHKVWVWKETHVEHEICFRRNSVAVSEAHHRDKQRPPSGVLKTVDDELPQFVHIELRRVDHDVCQPSNRSHAPALFAYSFSNRSAPAKRMRSPRLAETPYQGFVAGLDKYERCWVLVDELAVDARQLIDLFAFARVHQQRGALNLSAFHIQLAKFRNQRDGQIINAVKSKVFKCI